VSQPCLGFAFDENEKNYVGLVPTYYAGIRFELHNPNPDPDL